MTVRELISKMRTGFDIEFREDNVTVCCVENANNCTPLLTLIGERTVIDWFIHHSNQYLVINMEKENLN